MKNERTRKLTGIILSLLFLGFCTTPPCQQFFSIPSHLKVTQGQVKALNLGFPFIVKVDSSNRNIIKLNGEKATQTIKATTQRRLAIEPIEKGQANLEFKLLGFIPVHKMVVEVLPEIRVIPSGHSIGVILHSNGAMVVGYAGVSDKQGNELFPAKEAGINIGDTILKVNGKRTLSEEKVAEMIDYYGKGGEKITLTIEREKKVYERVVIPRFCNETKRYRVGLYVRDNVSGVGTMTFYHPDSKRFGALGHVITDADTNKKVAVEDGEIVSATISAVRASHKSRPGEKIGIFQPEKDIIGTIEKNTEFGIYGILKGEIENKYFPTPIPIALSSQIRRGPAQILTVIEEDKVEAFDVEIEKVFAQDVPTSKGLIIRVTDKELLEKTGGIVQGMSGSPIIQDGKFIGAITHVFINDPIRGYGCLAEWMVEEAGLNTEADYQDAA